MQQHGALAHPGRSSGVLQHGDIVGGDRDRLEHRASPLRDRVVEWHRPRQVECRSIGFFTLRRTKLTIAPHGRAEHVADGSQDDLLRRDRIEHLLQRRRELLEDDDGPGARILQLVLELARRVQRIDVDDDHARAQDAGDDDRVLGDVGHHDGDALAGRQAQGLDVGGERARHLLDQRVAVALAHELERIQPGVFPEALVEKLHERCVFARVDMLRHPFGVVLQPVAFHLVSAVRALLLGKNDYFATAGRYLIRWIGLSPERLRRKRTPRCPALRPGQGDHSTALSMSSTTFLASPNTIIDLSM